MTQQAPSQPSSELDAIRATALDYAQGWYEGDVERVGRSLHSELAKRRILQDSQTGELIFRHVSKQRLVSLTQQGGGTDTPAERRYYDVSVLDVSGDIASVRVNSCEYVDYLHLA